MRTVFAFITIILLLVSCQTRFEPEITTHELEGHIAYLASDELQGRYPGSMEEELLSDYISREYKKAGLSLYEKTGIQPFGLVTDIKAGPGCAVKYHQTELELGVDYNPFSFSASGSVNAPLVFAGYGFQVDLDTLHLDDYSSVEVSGKWVMLLRGIPGKQDASSPLFNFSEDRGKALMASDRNVAGVILVSGEQVDPGDALVELKGKQHLLNIPVIHMTRLAAEGILAAAGSNSLASLDALITAGEPASFSAGIDLDISVDLVPSEVKTFNTIAFLEGSEPELQEEYVVIGAHHDHLGLGGPGTSSRAPDTVAVHYGADDNASGVAGVIEIAEQLSGRSPSRSIMFATFGAEEMGLVGSRYLAENPPVDLAQVQAMINLDMVGRLNSDRQLQIGGTGTSPDFHQPPGFPEPGLRFQTEVCKGGIWSLRPLFVLCKGHPGTVHLHRGTPRLPYPG